MMDANTDTPISLAEAARLYRKSHHTLKAAIQRGDLRAHKIGARRYEIFRADIVSWIREQRVESAPDRARRLLEAD